jgi:hypothetical protein
VTGHEDEVLRQQPVDHAGVVLLDGLFIAHVELGNGRLVVGPAAWQDAPTGTADGADGAGWASATAGVTRAARSRSSLLLRILTL